MLSCLAVALIGGTAAAQSATRFKFREAMMGTEFRIVAYGTDETLIERAATAAMRRGREIDSLLSDYRSGSELSRLSRISGSDSCATVSPELLQVLVHARQLSEESEGAFDVTIGPLSRLWRWAMRRGQLPSDSRLQTARSSVGYQHLLVDSVSRCVRLAIPEMQLDVGGIAKGFAADEMLETLSSWGFRSALIDAGGDIVVGDPPMDTDNWVVDARTLDSDGHFSWQSLHVTNAAVATSGDRHRNLVANGIRYSHILDPRTGLGLTQSREVTVVAPTGIEADALASAISVMGRQGLSLADRPGYGARMIESDGQEHRVFEVGLLSR
jgi:thiamine biosynthesis lipoprotein